VGAGSSEVCENGELRRETCVLGCVSISGKCAECAADSVECSTNKKALRRCVDGFWGSSEPCDAATFCTADGCTGECAPDSERCNLETGDAEECGGDGEWHNKRTCKAQAQICETNAGQAQCVTNTPIAFGPAERLEPGGLETADPLSLRVFRLPPELRKAARVVSFLSSAIKSLNSP
jgi:hypothetical protein